MKFLNGNLSRILLLAALLWVAVAGVSVQAQDEQIAASADLAVSLHLPAGYVFSSQQGSDVYASVLVWAEDNALLERAIQSFYLGGATGPGNFGVLVVVNPQFWSRFSGFPDDALPQVLQIATTNPAAPITVNQQFQYDIGGLYTAVVVDATSEVINRRSYIGGFVSDNEMILFSLNTSPMTDFETEAPLLEAIGDSIRIPAEQGASTTSLSLGTPTLARPEDLPTRVPSTQGALPVVPASEDVFFVTREDLASVVLPSSWIAFDVMPEVGILAYGDSEDAARSRVGAIRPDLVENTNGIIVGTGGLVELYTMQELGIDPQAIDLEPLMSRLVQDLTSRAQPYEIVEQPSPLGDAGALIMVVRGAEYGYIALVPVPELEVLAYVSATGVDDTFEPNRDLLLRILQSVSVPAGEPPVAAESTAEPTPARGALGGLGGLQQATPTPQTGGVEQATPTPGKISLEDLALTTVPTATPPG